jgi:hypothetical protein
MQKKEGKNQGRKKLKQASTSTTDLPAATLAA